MRGRAQASTGTRPAPTTCSTRQSTPGPSDSPGTPGTTRQNRFARHARTCRTAPERLTGAPCHAPCGMLSPCRSRRSGRSPSTAGPSAATAWWRSSAPSSTHAAARCRRSPSSRTCGRASRPTTPPAPCRRSSRARAASGSRSRPPPAATGCPPTGCGSTSSTPRRCSPRGRAALRSGDAARARDLGREARGAAPGGPRPGRPATTAHLLADVVDAAGRGGARARPRSTDLVEDLRRLALRTPPDEPLVALLVRVLAAQGRDAEALEVVDQLRTELADRYGTDPSPVVAQAHLALLRGRAGAPGPPRRRRAVARACPPRLAPARDRAGRPRRRRRPGGGGARARRRSSRSSRRAGRARRGWPARSPAARSRPVGRSASSSWPVCAHPPRCCPPCSPRSAGPTRPPPATDLPTERRLLTPEDRLRLAAQDLDGLLVLDNCEHVLDAAAVVVGDLLAVASPDVVVLATSRAPLGLVGESVHRLRALPDADALELLESRARAGRATLGWDPERALELCHRLDNLPLALELAAARLRSHDRRGRAGRPDRPVRAARRRPARAARAAREPVGDGRLEPRAARPARPRRCSSGSRSSPRRSPPRRRSRSRARTRRDRPARARHPRRAVAAHARRGRRRAARATGCSRPSGSTARRGWTPPASGRRPWRGWSRWAAADRRAARRGLRRRRPAGARSTACAAEQETFLAALRWAVEHGRRAGRGRHRRAPCSTSGASAACTSRSSSGRCGLLHADDPRRPPRVGPVPGRRGRAGRCPTPTGWPPPASSSASTPASPPRSGSSRSRGGRSGRARRPARPRCPRGCARSPPRCPRSAPPDVDAEPTPPPSGWSRPTTTFLHGLGLFMRAAVRENAGDPAMSSADAREAYRAFQSIGDHWGMGMAAQGVGQWQSARGGGDAEEWLMREPGAPRAGRGDAGRPQPSGSSSTCSARWRATTTRWPSCAR